MVCSAGSNVGGACMTNTDCPGGGTCLVFQPHPGVCNSPATVALSGTFAPGDVAITLPLSLTVLSAPAPTPPADYGDDHLPCTADDTAAPAPPVTVALSTGTNNVLVYDVNDVSGQQIAPGALCSGLPCIAQITGQKTSCMALSNGNVAGTTLGGGFPALDTQASDIATVFQFTLENAPQ
jgi:hypothetical protein